MKNLAGDKDCDVIIIGELSIAGIPFIRVPIGNTEVPYTCVGRLGPYEFRRAWYYWVVKGPVPLVVAEEMYKNPIGAKDVRVAGHCGCPPPIEWADWITPEGKVVISIKEYQGFKKYIDSGVLDESSIDPYEFSDDPESMNAKLFVTNYHIDSQEGLNLFTSTIKKYALDIVSNRG